MMVRCTCADELNFGEPQPDCSRCGGRGEVPAQCAIEKHVWIKYAEEPVCAICDALRMPDGEIVYPRKGGVFRRGAAAAMAERDRKKAMS